MARERGGLVFKTVENALIDAPPQAVRPSGGDQETDGWEGWAHAVETGFDTVFDVIEDLEAKRRRQLHELELKIAELTGALGVIQRGGGLNVRGVHSASSSYARNDVVMVGGSSFVAIRDNVGSSCPGEDWKLLASAGRRGERGFTGPKGERGEPGENVTAGPGFKAFHLDRKTYTIFLSTADGRIHELSLRGLFEQFVSDMRGDL
jgi:hypothetical protein